MLLRFALKSTLFLLCMFGALYAQDAGSPSAGGSVAADLGSPQSIDDRIQRQAKHLEQMRSTAADLKMGDMDELKKAYIKTRKSGVDISPEDFLAFRMALDKLAQSNSAPAFLTVRPGELSAVKLNEASTVTLALNKSPTAALMDTFKIDKRKAQEEWKLAKQMVKDSKKQTKDK